MVYQKMIVILINLMVVFKEVVGASPMIVETSKISVPPTSALIGIARATSVKRWWTSTAALNNAVWVASFSALASTDPGSLVDR